MANIRLKSVYCIAETDGWGSDDLYVLTLAVNPLQRQTYRGIDRPILQHEVLRFGRFDADDGMVLTSPEDFSDLSSGASAGWALISLARRT